MTTCERGTLLCITQKDSRATPLLPEGSRETTLWCYLKGRGAKAFPDGWARQEGRHADCLVSPRQRIRRQPRTNVTAGPAAVQNVTWTAAVTVAVAASGCSAALGRAEKHVDAT
jgi:hypothetical protein